MMRPSGEFKIESTGTRVVRYLVGMIILGAAGYSQWVELHTDRNGWHELGYWCGLIVGATTIYPRLLAIVTGYGRMVGPYIPGGRRAYDPPVPPLPESPPKKDDAA